MRKNSENHQKQWGTILNSYFKQKCSHGKKKTAKNTVPPPRKTDIVENE